MAKVVFIPFPETGHFNATFRLAKSLKSRGHEVAYLGLSDFEESVRVQQLNFTGILESAFPRGFIEQELVKQGVETLDALVSQTERLGPDFDPLAELGRVVMKARPDILMVDLLLPAVVAMAKAAGLPSIFVNTQFYNPWDEPDSLYRSLEDIPELILCPEEFDFPRPRKRARCHYVEASIDDERNETSFPWRELDPGRRLVYCSLGTQSHLIKGSRRVLQHIIDGVSSEGDFQLVLASGANLGRDKFGVLPSNVIVVQQAPQLALLKRTAVAITHGGFNTVKECILFGVPIIVFPLIRDHPAVAARVVHYGLGLRGSFDNVTPESIQLMVRQVDRHPSIRTRVRSMSERFRELEQSGKAIEVFESILSDIGQERRTPLK